VDALNSSLAQSVGELWGCKVAEHLAKKWRTRVLKVSYMKKGKTKLIVVSQALVAGGNLLHNIPPGYYAFLHLRWYLWQRS